MNDHSDNTDEKEKTEKKVENEKVEREAADRVEAEEQPKLPWLRYKGAPEKTHAFSAQINLVADLSETESGESITDKMQILQVKQIE